MTPTDERDIATTLRALVEGRVDTARAAASLAAVVTQAERVARAEGHHAGREAGMLEAAAECERRIYWGTARILTRMARPVEVLVVRGAEAPDMEEQAYLARRAGGHEL